MRSREPSSSRPGKTLVMFALCLPVLLGMVGLVIDCGLSIAAQRAAQNAADAAALAAALAGFSGGGDPRAVAAAYVAQNNGPAGATVTAFNNPPAAGPHASSRGYYEVVVTCPVTSLFMPVLSVDPDQYVRARSVAGFEPVPVGQAVAALDPTAAPGLEVAGGGRFSVNGRVLVNALAGPAAVADDGARVEAAAYRIAGGSVSGPFAPYPGSRGALALDRPPAADPLINLPTPASSANGPSAATPPSWTTRALGSPLVTAKGATGLAEPNHVDASGVVQLYPGVYRSLTVRGGTVYLNPGVYVLRPTAATTYALDLAGGTVIGLGVMFYNTGGDYDPETGAPDSGDARLYDPGPSGTNAPPSGQYAPAPFGGIRIDASGGGSIALSAPSRDGDPFQGMLVYQRRANARAVEIAGGRLALVGTLYAKWSPLHYSGGGTLWAQFIVGSLRVSGQEGLTLAPGALVGRSTKVFLVE